MRTLLGKFSRRNTSPWRLGLFSLLASFWAFPLAFLHLLIRKLIRSPRINAKWGEIWSQARIPFTSNTVPVSLPWGPLNCGKRLGQQDQLAGSVYSQLSARRRSVSQTANSAKVKLSNNMPPGLQYPKETSIFLGSIIITMVT